MSDHFTKNALSWGPKGQLWLESIPSLISEFEEKWSVKVLPPFDLSYNYVAPAKRQDGSDVVFKIGFPEDKEFQTEIAALQIFAGEGCVKILESDPAKSVMLIERLQPGRPLSELADDTEATKIIVSVLKKLHKPLPAQHTFITVSEWTSALANYIQTYGDAGPLSLQLVQNAQELFLELIETSAPAVLVHGDLHHDNILSSERAGWLAIDPKGIAAEPLYEVAAMIRNPYTKFINMENLEPLLRKRIHVFSEELSADPHRIHKWCIAQTVLSAVWNVEGSNVPGHSGRVAEVLAGMRV